VVLQAYLPLRLAFGRRLNRGDSLSVPEFDTVAWDTETSDLAVLADSTVIFPDSAIWDSVAGAWIPARWDTLQAWKIRQTLAGQTMDLWIDELGQLVSVASGAGFHIDRTAFEIAFHNFRNRTIEDATIRGSNLIHQTPIGAGITSVSNDRSVLRVTLGNQNLAKESLVDARQQFDGDTLTITRDTEERLRSPLRLPASADEIAAEFLTATPVIQSDDPRIQARARLIIDGTRNASRATGRLITWVHETLRKQQSLGVPGALPVFPREHRGSRP